MAEKLLKEALFAHAMPEQQLRCDLCAQHCQLKPGETGVCGERINHQGVLYTSNYGRLIAAHVDPIEKKPLYHFLPGSRSFSIAAPGCNFRCEWCQNWDISQASPQNDPKRLAYVSPQATVSQALNAGCSSISYTYTEPTVFFEYALDAARLAKEAGLRNVFVTNGYMTRDALEAITQFLDAANVDIKAFSDEVYRNHIGARLRPVLESCERMKAAGIWLEVTTLLIPGLNDDGKQLQALAQYIATRLGVDTPWHISRYFPQYQFQSVPPTSLESIALACRLGAEAGLKFVYGGNVSAWGETHCPNCGALLLSRQALSLAFNHLKDGCCPTCGTHIAGVWA